MILCIDPRTLQANVVVVLLSHHIVPGTLAVSVLLHILLAEARLLPGPVLRQLVEGAVTDLALFTSEDTSLLCNMIIVCIGKGN